MKPCMLGPLPGRDDELMLNVLRCHLTYWGQVVTNAEARFNCQDVSNAVYMTES